MKKYLLFILMFICCFSLIACSNSNVGEEFELVTKDQLEEYDGVINIKFRVPSGINYTTLQVMVPEFERLWDGKIKVELESITDGYTGIRTQTIYDLNAGKAPTIVMGYPDHFAEYYNGGYLLDLQPYIDAEEDFDINDFVQSYLGENRISDLEETKNDLFGLPLNKSTEVLVYNKTVFDAMGYTVPTTWAEVETLSQTIIADCKAGKLDTIKNKIYDDEDDLTSFTEVSIINEGDLTPSKYLEDGRFYPFSYDSTSNAFITACRQWNAEYTEKVNIGTGYAVFNNDNAKTALAYFQDLATKGYYAIAETFDESYASNAFKALQCLMTVGSSAGVGYNVPDANRFEVGVAPVPVKDADSKYVIQQGTNVCILNQCDNYQRAAAWQLIKYITSTEQTVNFAMTSGGYLPVRNSGYETEEYKAYLANTSIITNPSKYYFSLSANVSITYRENFTMFVDPAFVGSATIRDEVGSLFSKIIVNKAEISATIEETLSSLGPKFQKK